MFDLIKPNTEWKQIAKEFNGEFMKGNLFSQTKMVITVDNYKFNIETDFSNDNFYTAKTIVYISYNYNKNFHLRIHKNLIPSIFGLSPRFLKISKSQIDLKEFILSNVYYKTICKRINFFDIIFDNEGLIDEAYDVHPILKLKTIGYIVDKDLFKTIFTFLIDLTKQFEDRKIINYGA